MRNPTRRIIRLTKAAAMAGALGGTLAVYSAPAALADPARNVTDYSITLSGLSLAKASFETKVDGARFEIAGSFRTTGLARLFRKVEGTASVSGKVKGNNFVADRYNSNYVAGSAHKSYDIAFAKGGVKSFKADPAITNPPANWVAVTTSDLLRAVDPLSGLILPGNSQVCAGTIAVFDGEALTDLQLTDKGQAMYRAGNVRMEARICGLRITPKAGYRKGKGDMDYVARLKGMEIWFAKSPIADVYAPVKIKAPTGFGSVEISATRFGA